MAQQLNGVYRIVQGLYASQSVVARMLHVPLVVSRYFTNWLNIPIVYMPVRQSIFGAVASRRTRGPIDNISFGAPVWHVTNHNYSGVPNVTSVPNSVNDMACCVISFTALTVLISWYRTIDSLYSDVFEVDPAGPGRTALASPRAGKLPPWQSPSPTSSRFPRNARFIMASVMIMFIILSKHFLPKVASVAFTCSWTRSML